MIVISASSDIGAAICRRWMQEGWNVSGTYRRKSAAAAKLKNDGAKLFACDLLDQNSVDAAARKLGKSCPEWDALILCAGLMEPVGPFIGCRFDEWEDSVRVNFTGQLRFVHALLPFRNKDAPLGPCVIFFAGGGTNSAPVNYSAYISAKIALIKMCELLDAEVPDSRFVIIGPGWVKTKIHNATLRAKKRAGANYARTLERLAANACTPMDKVLDCCRWLLTAHRKAIGGRNISVASDGWSRKEFLQHLVMHPQAYKLRRFQR